MKDMDGFTEFMWRLHLPEAHEHKNGKLSLPSMLMVSSLCFTCSAIILLMDIRLSVMSLLVSTRLSLVTLLGQRKRKKHTQHRSENATSAVLFLHKKCESRKGSFPLARQGDSSKIKSLHTRFYGDKTE